MNDQQKTETWDDPIHDQIGDLETHILDFSEGGGAADYVWMSVYRQAFHIFHLAKFIDIAKVSKLPSITKAAKSSLVAFRKAKSLEDSFFKLLRRDPYTESTGKLIESDRPGVVALEFTPEAFIKEIKIKYAQLLAEKIQSRDASFFRKICGHFEHGADYQQKDSVPVTAQNIVLASWPYSFCLMTEGAANAFFTYCKRLIERDSPQLFDTITNVELSEDNFRQIKKRKALVSSDPPLIRDLVFNKDLTITSIDADRSICSD